MSSPPKLGGWGSEQPHGPSESENHSGMNNRPCTHLYSILPCLLNVGRPCWGREVYVYLLFPHHLLLKLIQGYGKVTALQS